jgi:hypothetical protein
VDLQEALTRKIGPLPAWAYGVGIGGGVLLAKTVFGGRGSSGDPGGESTIPAYDYSVGTPRLSLGSSFDQPLPGLGEGLPGAGQAAPAPAWPQAGALPEPEQAPRPAALLPATGVPANAGGLVSAGPGEPDVGTSTYRAPTVAPAPVAPPTPTSPVPSVFGGATFDPRAMTPAAFDAAVVKAQAARPATVVVQARATVKKATTTVKTTLAKIKASTAKAPAVKQTGARARAV